MSGISAAQSGIRHIIDNTNYPDYIRNHAVFQNLNKIVKVFPRIGLPNLTESIDYSGALEARSDAINLLYVDMRTKLYDAFRYTGGSSHLRDTIYFVYGEVSNRYMNMIFTKEERVVLRFNTDVNLDGKPFIRKGEKLFKVYNKIAEKTKENGYEMPALESLQYFKAFSASNVPNRNYKMVFSSAGEEGAWDIATISMRGISSCQSWGTSQSRGLVGSIASKYVGTAYITTGEKFNEHGSRMVRRVMVRFAINKNTKKPALLLDKVYPGDDQTVRGVFKDFLHKKTGLPVLFPLDPEWKHYYLPDDEYVKTTTFQTNEHTYMDSKIPFKSNLETPKDYASYYQRLAMLDNALQGKVHTNIIKMMDEYCANKKAHKEVFKGGVANFILSLKTHIGGTRFAAYHIPLLHQNPLPNWYPNISNFDTGKEYERAVIKTAFSNMAKLTATSKSNYKGMGKWMRFYPKSLEKFHSLLMTEYKKELLAAYKQLL